MIELKWLLVVFVFQLDPSGKPTSPVVVTDVYDSEDECNRIGRNARDAVDAPIGSQSLSTCIPQSAFESRG
jgi:hypothetical protein